MQRIRLDQDIKTLSEFSSNISKRIRRVQENRRPLVITQQGKSAAILGILHLPVDTYGAEGVPN